jgi:uncharacterized protein (TIGR02266 family)
VEIWAEEAVAGGVYFHRITNLSRNGFFIEKQLPFPVGAVVEVRFDLPEGDRPLAVRGEVVDNYRDAQKGLRGAGIRFLDMDPDTRRQIDRCIRHFDADGASEA